MRNKEKFFQTESTGGVYDHLPPHVQARILLQERRFERALTERLKRLRDEEEPAYCQRAKTLPAEQRGREAIESFAKEVVEWNLRNGGKINTYEKAREYVARLANRHVRRGGN